jgi:acyl-CoA synthetase (AMP-forming)/AMP-acid ligase II
VDTAVLLYTTGTTGAAKGVMLTHGNLRFAGAASAALRAMTPADTLYGVLPMTHVFGLASMLMAAAHAGAAIRLEARFAPDRLLAALRSGVTVFPGVPQMHGLLMAHVAASGAGRLEGTALRYVSSGGAPLDPAWKRRAEGFYGLPLQNGYGMTESTAGICGTRNAIGDPDISVGPPLPGIEVALDRSKAADPDVGEILTRGPHVMAGYHRAPDLSAEVLDAEGWLRTGDLGRIDGEGRLHVVGRCKELIIRGGFNVYPPEVEAALNDHPDVIQCAVVGRAVDGDEEVLAFVQCLDPDALDVAALHAFAATRLTAYKRPRRIVAARALPAAPTGKILKHKLIETFSDRLDPQEESA